MKKPSVLRVESLTGVEVDLSLEKKYCQCSSGVEHFLGKEEVTGSNPVIGSKLFKNANQFYKNTKLWQKNSFNVPNPT